MFVSAIGSRVTGLPEWPGSFQSFVCLMKTTTNNTEQFVSMDGFDFCFDPAVCDECQGRCCRGESGTVHVSEQEMQALADYLQTNMVDFINTCLVRKANRPAIKEKRTEAESVCLFFDTETNRCSVYAVRPVQCRTFPFWEYFKAHPALVAAECPGVRNLP